MNPIVSALKAAYWQGAADGKDSSDTDETAEKCVAEILALLPDEAPKPETAEEIYRRNMLASCFTRDPGFSPANEPAPQPEGKTCDHRFVGVMVDPDDGVKKWWCPGCGGVFEHNPLEPAASDGKGE